MNSILQELLEGQVDLDSLVKDLIEDFLETLLKAELTEHLNYERYNVQGRNTGNSRNAYYQRSLKTKYGEIKDQFDTALFQPYKRCDNWLEEMIVTMYARGLSTRDIADIIEKIYGSQYSAASVSNLTDVAIEELTKWQSRDLKKRYSVLYIDGMAIKLRRESVDNESVYVVIGIDEEGYREILDFYIGPTESSTLWKEVLTNLKSRGVEEILLGVMDGLPGLKDAFLSVRVGGMIDMNF